MDLGILETSKDLDVVVISRTNWISGDKEGNKDNSEERIKHASELAVGEEKSCLKALGINYLKLLGIQESLLRGYGMEEHGIELMYPNGFNFEASKDKRLVSSLKHRISPYLRTADEVYLPLAIRGHIDHLLVREAGISEVKELDSKGLRKARVFLGEDLPYAGDATKAEWEEPLEFIRRHGLEKHTHEIDVYKKLGLFRHYPNQIWPPAYAPGVLRRAIELGSKTNPKEAVYEYKK